VHDRLRGLFEEESASNYGRNMVSFVTSDFLRPAGYRFSVVMSSSNMVGLSHYKGFLIFYGLETVLWVWGIEEYGLFCHM